MTTVEAARDWRIARHLLRSQLTGATVIWVLFATAVALIAVLIEVFGSISASVLEQATYLVKWFAFAMGAYLTAAFLPLYVAHGHTRREFAAQAPVFGAVFAVVLAVLTAAGLGVERLVLGALGRGQALAHPHLFDSPAQVHLVVLEYSLVFAIWAAVGALLAGAFYRDGGLGLVLIPVGLFLVAAGQAAVGAGNFGPLGPMLEFDVAAGRTAPAAAALGMAVLAVTLALTWTVVRDLPLRTKQH